MGRAPCCDNKSELKKGPWTAEEDEKLIDYIKKHGPSKWRTLPKNAGLQRCGKSCRLRWSNYLRPDIKRGRFSFEEEETIIQLHSILGNKWSAIAARLPGRTDNEIKNHWNTHIRKKLLRMGIDPVTHTPRFDLFEYLSSAIGSTNNNNNHQLYHNNLSSLMGLQALLNPELLQLITSLGPSSSQESQQQLCNTQIPNHHQSLPSLIHQHQHQHQPVPVGPVHEFAHTPAQLGPNMISCQTSPENSSAATQSSVEQWDATLIDQLLLNNGARTDHDLGFDSSIASTPLPSPYRNDLNSSSPAFINTLLSNHGHYSTEDESCGFDYPETGFFKFDAPDRSLMDQLGHFS